MLAALAALANVPNLLEVTALRDDHPQASTHTTPQDIYWDGGLRHLSGLHFAFPKLLDDDDGGRGIRMLYVGGAI
ncbi:hypothetical protein F5B22DRAFT_584030 [Xylaria bambusicola]|uniref:uncharacterized protein n=1 Tax=Xylaria bambusicola TaxID=326684 RepID=UPI002008C77F|nr:uncharacterized protein F5B22DRAFT_584030 [Xylaria bambusicola]KAI0528181.1 hypothetical protein F5B22DRAFT_584030 [Xylaria bambusicola]